MENNASSAGVRRGGLFNTTDIKILICYLLASIDEPIPANQLANLLHYEGIANAFEVSDAIVALVKSGQIKQFDKNDDSYIITEMGRNTAETLKTSISYSVKDRAYAASIKMLAKFKNAKDTKFETTHENGHIYLTCSILDSGIPFFSVKLQLTDEDQAHIIKEKFLEDPAAVYSLLIEHITK